MFCQKYYDIEQPVIIEKAGENWPGRNKWNNTYLRQELLKEPSIRTTEQWYWMKRGGMSNDYVTPPIVEKLWDRSDIFTREMDIRIWAHEKGYVSSWHYDGNMVNVFNAQMTEKKSEF